MSLRYALRPLSIPSLAPAAIRMRTGHCAVRALLRTNYIIPPQTLSLQSAYICRSLSYLRLLLDEGHLPILGQSCSLISGAVSTTINTVVDTDPLRALELLPGHKVRRPALGHMWSRKSSVIERKLQDM